MFLLGSLGLDDYCGIFIPSLGSCTPKEPPSPPFLTSVSHRQCGLISSIPCRKSKLDCVQKLQYRVSMTELQQVLKRKPLSAAHWLTAPIFVCHELQHLYFHCLENLYEIWPACVCLFLVCITVFNFCYIFGLSLNLWKSSCLCWYWIWRCGNPSANIISIRRLLVLSSNTYCLIYPLSCSVSLYVGGMYVSVWQGEMDISFPCRRPPGELPVFL